MIPRIEHIGQSSSSSWPKRLRRWLNDLFGSKYAQLLERELLQARLEKDRAIAELKAERDRVLEALMATKGVPLRMPAPVTASEPKSPVIPRTNWQRLQAEAIAENARLEEEDAKKTAAQEN